MTQHQTSRTLVKSVPELWAECSDAGSLARHLRAFGEIRITKLEPETAIAWEGTAARGTVTLEPSGWGTRVTLTLTEEERAAREAAAAAREAAAADDPDDAAVEDLPVHAAVGDQQPAEARHPLPLPEPRLGFLARLLRRLRGGGPSPVPVDAGDADSPAPADSAGANPPRPPDTASAAAAQPGEEALLGEDALLAALDSLGRAHHRPYSRT